MTKTKLVLAGVAFAIVGATIFGADAASAADLPPVLPVPQHRAPAYVPFNTWAGAYIGINAGYGFGKSLWTDSASGASTNYFDINGGLAGGTLGYNWQSGGWVYGLETDFDWSGIKGSATTGVCGGTCTTNNTWLGTARGRLGYSVDRLMTFVSAGAAYGNLKFTDGVGSGSRTKVGWTLGGGIEGMLTGNWSAKLDYYYVDLGKATCSGACAGGGSFDVTYRTVIVRAGLNYRF